MNKSLRFLSLLPVVGILFGCGGEMPNGPPAETEAAEAAARGPNNGRLLAEGDFVLELAIFETGVPPEFRAWAPTAAALFAPRICSCASSSLASATKST